VSDNIYLTESKALANKFEKEIQGDSQKDDDCTDPCSDETRSGKKRAL